jgi:hypothetical protein
MRRAPDNFVPALRAQWMACVMHDILGLETLSGASALGTGRSRGIPPSRARGPRCGISASWA